MIRRDDAAKDGGARLGPSGLAGFGSAKGSNEEAYLFQKLVRTGFGTNNVDHCTRLCHASSVVALIEGIGSGAVTAPFTAADDADCIIVIGARPEQNHPVAATYLKNRAKQGAKLIVADPRGQGLGRHASYNLTFKAGTDVALLNAMLHTIIEEELYDTQYLHSHTEGFDELAERVKAFPPEKMAEVCGIDAATVREVARVYATSKNSIIFWGMGISQSVHGTDNARGLIALALITGHVGRPGTGLHPLRGQNNVQGASDAGLIPTKRGLTVVEIMNAIHAGEIRAMYVLGENPAMSDPDQAHARAALAKLEHLVVQDIFLTETAWHADVVLPASAHPEKTGTFTNTNRQVQLGREVVPLPGDTRQDWWITQEIARRIGLDWNYSHPRDVFAEMAEIMPSLANITWDRLEREDAVTYPCDAPDKPGNAIIFGTGFPTKSGRARIVPTDLTPPAELPDDDYPMILTTGRMLEHWHTGAMTRRAGTLERDVKRLQLAPGDFIRVSTRRGAITLRVRIDREVADGMVFIPFCYTEAAANLLTNSGSLRQDPRVQVLRGANRSRNQERGLKRTISSGSSVRLAISAINIAKPVSRPK
jgi:formate dehydrogenase major subunit